MAAVAIGTIIAGVTLASAVLAATVAGDRLPDATSDRLPPSELQAAWDVTAQAAADALAISTDELAGELADGRSLKQIADAREVGYGDLARSIKAAADRELRRTGAAAVMQWVDIGGQPDAPLVRE